MQVRRGHNASGNALRRGATGRKRKKTGQDKQTDRNSHRFMLLERSEKSKQKTRKFPIDARMIQRHIRRGMEDLLSAACNEIIRRSTILVAEDDEMDAFMLE